MAKASGSRGGTARIRFVMLDAEIPDGDLDKVTIAIQNALRPATIPQRISGPTTQASIAGHTSESLTIEESNDLSRDEINNDAVVAPAEPPRERKERRYPVRKVVEVDLNSNISWESYINGMKPSSDNDRFLIVASWFKECRGQESITADEVYTCCRAVGWPTSNPDFAAPLRHLKRRQFMSGDGGKYIINHLGIDRVKKLRQGRSDES